MQWDTRKGPRSPISVRVSLQVNPEMEESIRLSKSRVDAEVTEINLGGVRMTSTIFLPKGAVVDLEFPRSAFRTGEEGTLTATGRIVYAKQTGDKCQMGLSFTRLEEADRRLIQDFLSKKSR